MQYDHDDIRRAYPTEVKTIIDDKGIFGFDKKPFTVDQAKVDAARAELDSELYRIKRSRNYPSWRAQLEYIYDHGVEKWKTDMVDPIKAKYPKP